MVSEFVFPLQEVLLANIFYRGTVLDDKF